MYRVVMASSCGCFAQSGEPKKKEFETKEEAIDEANRWVAKMNEEFCKKHEFSYGEYGTDLIVKVRRKH